MRIFKLNNVYDVVCQFKGTRQGFKHEAIILKNGIEQDKTKICYLNRTWERFEYESVLFQIINKYFKNEEVQKYRDIIKQFN